MEELQHLLAASALAVESLDFYGFYVQKLLHLFSL